jgi:AraC-like DNA-binding protein
MTEYTDRAEERYALATMPKLVRTLANDSQFAVMRMTVETDHEVMTSIPPENSLVIALQLKDFVGAELWIDDRPVPVGTLLANHLSFYDLRQPNRAFMKGSFDYVQFYIPQAIFDDLTDRIGRPRVTEIQALLGQSIDDPVMANLTAALMPALERPHEAGTVYVDHIAYALAAHIAQTYGGLSLEAPAPREGLSRRHEAMAKDLLRECLEQELRLSDIATACGMPVGRFVRAFQMSTGMPPHRWLRAYRVEHAKDLLLASDLSLAQIAFACGFADQSHFSRVFAAWTRSPPGAWRRSRRS